MMDDPPLLPHQGARSRGMTSRAGPCARLAPRLIITSDMSAPHRRAFTFNPLELPVALLSDAKLRERDCTHNDSSTRIRIHAGFQSAFPKSRTSLEEATGVSDRKRASEVPRCILSRMGERNFQVLRAVRANARCISETIAQC